MSHPVAGVPINQVLQDMHREFAAINDGEVATYIPELAKANPDWFGICLVTPGGQIYEVGDTAQAFTIQSISKPFVYGLALEDNGLADVSAKVGVEPTGEAFNSISLEPGTGRPRNAMINAGAIATTGLVGGGSLASRRDRIVATLSRYAGRPLVVDAAVHRSESETGHRNRAIGHMLRNFDILPSDPTPTVDMYFQQCAVSVTCRDLAVMAATLANHGVNPLTGQIALRGAYVEHVLTVMSTCGMYNWSGEWLYRVGIPSKSGVSGGVLAVLPGQLGIGVFSPRLDGQGNSVRGIKVCERLSRYFDLHLFNLRRPAPALRNRYDVGQVGSRRVRPATERAVLAAHGAEAVVFELQGSLGFATMEPVIHAAVTAEFGHLLVDLRRVQTLSESAAHLLHDLILDCAGRDRSVLFCHAREHRALLRVVTARLGPDRAGLFRIVDEYDDALEWCEDQVVARHASGPTTPEYVPAEDNELFAGLTAAQRARLQARLRSCAFPAGATLITAGEKRRGLYLLERGHTSVYVPLASGGRRRIASLCPGMVLGELALIDDSPRSANVVADTAITAAELAVEDFEAIAEEHPDIKFQVLKNLCLGLCDKLRKANTALAVLE